MQFFCSSLVSSAVALLELCSAVGLLIAVSLVLNSLWRNSKAPLPAKSRSVRPTLEHLGPKSNGKPPNS